MMRVQESEESGLQVRTRAPLYAPSPTVMVSSGNAGKCGGGEEIETESSSSVVRSGREGEGVCMPAVWRCVMQGCDSAGFLVVEG